MTTLMLWLWEKVMQRLGPPGAREPRLRRQKLLPRPGRGLQFLRRPAEAPPSQRSLGGAVRGWDPWVA